MSMSGSETKSLEAKCFCGSVHFTVDVPTSLLPLPAYICHCSICRYSTGAPCLFHASLPRGLTPNFIAPSAEQNLTQYQPAQGGTYDFCSACGCHVAGVSFDRLEWTVSTSIFLHRGPADFEIVSHVFSKSGPGGAIPACLSEIGGRQIQHYNPPDDDARSKVDVPPAELGPDGHERLRARCHCGGVSFTIGRPDQRVLEDEFLSRFVSPLDKNKWIATYDVCDDCRLINGSHVAGWTFAPLALCDPVIGKDLKLGSSKTYVSSEGVLRSFCGTCGATVFFSSAQRRPADGRAVVDIATGILRCPEGVMGENWFTWRARLAYEASGIRFDRQLGEALRDAMKAYSREKYGQELTMEIV
ncbi:uncharacterized protein UV8b_02715 [Ustilaginoidea virens]|uniref:CENP-V/GFA domain-containing protein n=1 Tax=Ustilaginoidea virens TaxID=1159556 RepID=A0A1B5L179_USTVR|nr:uncharacterized protein UV8b_02715 [Ustilaginoidea virens]QUC18474.1 hypothetical protein UV8b_02715 [Ustilaginoidea virens]GAO17177.1 hypothetical protein UVI_02031140 [Ustilaginoidea virens]